MVSALSKPILPITCNESEVTITLCTDVESWATKMPFYLGVVQLVERLIWDQEVVGSNPVTQTIYGK